MSEPSEVSTVPGTNPEPEPLVEFYVTTAIRTSAGSTVGAKLLPASEAAALHADRRGIYGSQPPAGFSGAAKAALSN